MPQNSISGDWTGIITYEKGYENIPSRVLHFEMNIVQEGEKIIGVAIYANGFGVNPEPADISGDFIDNRIDFLKQYRAYYYWENGEVRIDKTKPGLLIYYRGIYIENSKEFVGKWKVKYKVKLFGIIPIGIYPLRGSWRMSRK